MELRMNDEGANDRLATGDFDIPVTMGMLQPRQRWRATFRCDGYQATAAQEFDLGAVGLTCPTVVLGATQLEPEVGH